MPLLRNGKLAEDTRAFVADGEPAGEGAIVSVKRFLAERDTLLVRNEQLALRFEPNDDPLALADVLDRVSLIEVSFPKYTDGRGYSTAQLLRIRLGYTGELRAVGHVLRDQLAYMVRAGFDAMIYDSKTPEADFIAANGEFSEVYQATADGRETVFEKRHKPGSGNGA